VASEVALPSGVTLISEPETLIVNVVQAPSEQAMEAEVDAEGAGVVEDEPETAAGEASTDESSDSE